MKKSRYNFVRDFGVQSVLYNARTENLAVLDRAIADLYSAKTPDEIKVVHPEFYDYLVKKSFILDDSCDELMELKDYWDKIDNDQHSFVISLNPTLNCNMSCWYCYENHVGDLNMRDSVIVRIMKLIESKLVDSEIKQLHLCFFGGEPLLGFDGIVRRLVDYACNCCNTYGKRLSISFVTNGFLLTEHMMNYLNDTGIHVSFQITLDGNEKTHDSIRYTKVGDKTYRQILINALSVIRYPNMDLVLRCNYTSASLPVFLDVVADIAELKKDCSINISQMKVDLHRVWQDKEIGDAESLKEMEAAVRAAFIAEGIPITIVQRANRYRCYAEKHNQFLVNINGDLYRCTARDFSRDRAEGRLSPDGIPIWNEHYERRDAVKWVNMACKECNIYPLCCGACSQIRLESGNMHECDYGYNAVEKDEIVTERVQWLLEQSKLSTP